MVRSAPGLISLAWRPANGTLWQSTLSQHLLQVKEQMSKLPKLPAIQFYSGDWRKDLGVQSLSLHDRAVWFEMLLLMHESEERGYLVLNGKPIKDDILARIIGLDKQILTTALTNIEEAGVSSRREDGAIFNRRMVKDEKLRQVRTEAGKLGGNPALVKQKQTSGDKQSSTPSFASSSSLKTIAPSSDGPDAEHNALDQIFGYYLERTARKASAYTLTAGRKQKGLARLRECLGRSGGDLPAAVAMMKAAVDGICKSDWHMGRDPKTNGKRYVEWESHLFDSVESLERWVEQTNTGQTVAETKRGFIDPTNAYNGSEYAAEPAA
jgi:hypothetical protein